MAAMTSLGRRTLQTFCRNNLTCSQLSKRCLANRPGAEKPATEPEPEPEEDKPGWLTKLLTVRRIDPGRESHSRQLSDKDTVYELQNHKVKPEHMEQYLNEFHNFVNMTHEKKTGAQLAGSWTVEVGDQDEAVHLWKYPGGYPVLNKATEIYRKDKEFVDFRISRNKMLRSRKNQILLAFSFWGDVKPREGNHIYELRSYVLKPGTMIEWGNNWARGIKHRSKQDEAVAGYFAQIGDLYTVHHFWSYESMQDRDKIREDAWSRPGWHDCVANTAYDDLQSRKEVREAAWRRPGWDECVAHTVPLIRHMTAKVLIPTPFSPLQ